MSESKVSISTVGEGIGALKVERSSLCCNELYCHGKSTTLGVSSMEREDTMLLKMNDYGVSHFV